MAASGTDAEAALKDAMKENDGKYVLVVEGSIPTKDNGAYLKIAGRNGIDMLKDVANHAAAVISIGSCASWGGIPSSGPNPTGAVGVDSIIRNKPVVNIPGCPPNPYILLGTILEYAATGKLPKLDAKARPLFAYDRLIHDQSAPRAFRCRPFRRSLWRRCASQWLVFVQTRMQGSGHPLVLFDTSLQ
jgi:hydrogenase small subunit